MKICIDGRFIRSTMTGIGRYTLELITNLKKIDTENSYYLLVNPEFSGDLVRYSNVIPIFVKSTPFSLREQIEVPHVLKTYQIDIFHSPFYTRPLGLPCKTVMTIHDLIHLRMAREYSLAKQLYFRYYVRYMARHCDVVVTDSRHSANDIISLLGISANKVRMVYPGVTVKQIVATQSLNSVRSKYRLRDPYILYVGSNKPHKNVQLLLDAFVQFRNQGYQHRLVVTGEERNFSISDRLRSLIQSDELVFIPNIDEEDLPYVYSQASVFVFPSLYEGFGLPPLEAMSYGIPVLSSSASCLPEVLGEAAAMFDPSSVEELVTQLITLVDNSVLRRQMVQRGQENSKKYTWQEASRTILDICVCQSKC